MDLLQVRVHFSTKTDVSSGKKQKRDSKSKQPLAVNSNIYQLLVGTGHFSWRFWHQIIDYIWKPESWIWSQKGKTQLHWGVSRKHTQTWVNGELWTLLWHTAWDAWCSWSVDSYLVKMATLRWKPRRNFSPSLKTKHFSALELNSLLINSLHTDNFFFYVTREE